jgi:beta propeller repeat protein
MKKITLGILIILATLLLMGQMCVYPTTTDECDPECAEGYTCNEGVCEGGDDDVELTGCEHEQLFEDGDVLYMDYSGDYITWLSDANNDADGIGSMIYAYDITTGIKTEIGQVTMINLNGFPIKTDGNYVVWSMYDNNDYDYEIYMYNLATGTTTQITDDTLVDSSPYVYGDYIAWHTEEGEDDYDINLYQISTGVTDQITSTSEAEGMAMIYGNNLIWIKVDEINGNDLYSYDLTSGDTNLLASNLLKFSLFNYPDIYNENLVWADDEIYMYDLATGTTTQITSDSIKNYFASTYGNYVVWTKEIDSSYEIHMYDLATGTTTQITDDTLTDVFPSISDNTLVWLEDDGTKHLIYMVSDISTC